MKAKHLLILVLLLAILGTATAMLLKREKAAWQAPAAAGGKVLPAFDLNAVTEVRMNRKGAILTIEKKADAWTVADRGGYPANFDLVRTLIRKLWEMKSAQEIAASPSQFSRLHLLEPGAGGEGESGTLIELKDSGGNRLAALVAGKQHISSEEFGGGSAGRYIVALDGRNRVVLTGDSLDEISGGAKNFLDQSFVRPTELKSVAWKDKWTLQRTGEGAPWKLNGNAETDPAKTQAMAETLRSLSFDDVAANAAGQDFSQTDVVTAQTFDGFTYKWTLGKPDGETRPVKIEVSADLPAQRAPAADEKPEDKERLDKEFKAQREALEKRLAGEKHFEKWVYLIKTSSFAPVLITEKDLVPPPPPPAPEAGAAPGASATTAPVSVPMPQSAPN